MKRLNIKSKKIHPSPHSIKLVADIVEKGGIVVFPWGKLERKSLAIMCDSDNKEACRRINRIKNRTANQVLAINGYPELIPDVAKIENSEPLKAAAKRLGVDLIEILSSVMKIGTVSFIFEAREGLPEVVTIKSGNKKTVMIAGEIDDSKDYDFYTELIKHLHKRKIITAGSSANRKTSGTFHLFQQEQAYKDLASDIDLFVYHSPLPKKPLHALNLESCTCFNMMVQEDVPEVVRFGSVHPSRFKKVFGAYTIAKNVKYLPKREKVHHIWSKLLLKFFNRFVTSFSTSL